MRLSRRWTVLAAALLAAGAVSCGNKETPGGNAPTGPGKVATPAHSGKDRKIVFIFKVAGLAYGEACKKGAEQANSELSAEVKYLAPEKAEVGKQIAYIEQLIAQKVDAIVIAPNDDKAIVPIVKKAMDAGVKVFTWDSDAPKSERVFYVAAADDVQIGVDIANSVAKDIGGKGKVQIVSGGRAAANLNLHVQGMEQAFAKFPGITLVKPYIYNDDDNVKARSMAVQALQKDPDIVGFACANSPSNPAVGEAITQQGKIGKIKVWGLSLPKETAPYLKSGAVSGSMLWDPTKLTYATAKLVNDFLDGKTPKDGSDIPGVGKISVKNGVVLMPGITFTKDNVDQYNF